MVTSHTRSGAAWRQLADPAALLGIRFRQVSGLFFRCHGGEPRFLGRRILRDRFEGVAQHRFVIGADRTDIGATATAGDDAGAAQNALPEMGGSTLVDSGLVEVTTVPGSADTMMMLCACACIAGPPATNSPGCAAARGAGACAGVGGSAAFAGRTSSDTRASAIFIGAA
jgi:hypothetical protein